MRIAFIITCLEVGGAENQVVDLADALSRRGHDVLLVSLSGVPEVMPSNPEVRVEALNAAKTPSSLLATYWRVCRLIRAFAPDVVHSHMIHANLLARSLRLSVPVPRLVCTAHSINEGGRMRMWMYRLSDRLADLTTNVSNAAVAHYIACAATPRHKARAIHNGIDCRRFRFDLALRAEVRRSLGAADDTRVLLAAGNLCDAKDYPNLLQAFAAVAAQRGDCVLWIAGVGPRQASLQAAADAMACRARIRFLGLRRDMPALMSGADVFVLSSAWEGFPLVVGEAMACERIIVSTEAGGAAEWLGSQGYLVPIRDSAALAGAALQALDLDDEVRRAQGMQARERVRTMYSLEAAVLHWECVYRGDFGRCEPDPSGS